MQSLPSSSPSAPRHGEGSICRAVCADEGRRAAERRAGAVFLCPDRQHEQRFRIESVFSKALKGSEAGTIDIPAVPSLGLQKTRNLVNHTLGR